MPHTIDTALSDELVTVVERLDDMGSFRIKIGVLETEIQIELGRFMTSETTKFHMSHAIKTPPQESPYRTSHPFADYPGYALHRAVTGLTQYYREAVRGGHIPRENWLVPTTS